MTSLVWLRNDLRLADNPALRAAHARGGPIIVVYIDSRNEDAPWHPGGASRWWLGRSLESLDTSLRAIGSRLIVRHGNALDALRALVDESRATAVFWNRRYEPMTLARDAVVKRSLRADGLIAESFNASLLFEPWAIANQSGKPFQVFTPFWKRCLSEPDPLRPVAAPSDLRAPDHWPASTPLVDIGLAHAPTWAHAMQRAWRPGAAGARANLNAFLTNAFSSYVEGRNRPDVTGTSRLSPHLHFGEIGPRQVWHRVRTVAEARGLREREWRGSQYLAEIGWREFAHHLLYHFPHTPLEPLRTQFTHFPWRRDDDGLRAWQRGMTGFPIVDAGMRELWATGWMHNRVRMIVASFLVKDLLISWHDGARWFWDTLVDADLASNTMGWQWSAGCGADAAPYFRIFNPARQGARYDPAGEYVRRWCPELARLPAKWIHEPASAPADVLREAGVEIGRTYPHPIVNHKAARKEALEAYAGTRGTVDKQR